MEGTLQSLKASRLVFHNSISIDQVASIYTRMKVLLRNHCAVLLKTIGYNLDIWDKNNAKVHDRPTNW